MQKMKADSLPELVRMAARLRITAPKHLQRHYVLPLKELTDPRSPEKAKLAVFNDHVFEANGIVERLAHGNAQSDYLGG